MRSTHSLATLHPGQRGRVIHVCGDAEVARWLCALGIEAGMGLTVLRRGLWGGPLHVRAENGAEFALARPLAEDVLLDEERA